MAADVIDWAAIEETLRVWVRDAMELDDGQVIWGWPSHPQPLRPFAWLTLTTGLTHIGAPQNVKVAQPMRDRITVLSAAEGPYTVRVYEATPADTTGVAFTYDAPDGQTVEQTRDGWAAELEATGLTVTTDGTADILLDGTGARSAWHAVIESGDAELETEQDAVVEYTVSVDRFTVRVYVDADMGPGEPALSLLARAALAIRTTRVRRGLHASGLARARTGAPQNLTFFSGDKFVARASQDFQFNTIARLTEQKPWIRTAETTGAVVGGGA